MHRLSLPASVATALEIGDLQLSQHWPKATGYSDPGSPAAHTTNFAHKSEPMKVWQSPCGDTELLRMSTELWLALKCYCVAQPYILRSIKGTPTVNRLWLSPSTTPRILGYQDPRVGGHWDLGWGLGNRIRVCS